MSGASEVDPSAVEQAFVHESAAREGGGPSNERLEFFGDAVLGFVTARWLMRTYPEASEGELHRRKAAIVSGDACAQSARRLDMGEIVRLGVGAQQSGGATNTSILADAFEAYLGALYLITDIECVTRFLEQHHIAHADHADAARRGCQDRAAGIHASASAHRAGVLRACRRSGARSPLHLASADRR